MVSLTIPSSPQKSNHHRYARISKNLVTRGDLARAGRKVGLTGRDLHLLAVLLAEAQHRRKRRIVFSTLYEILELAGRRKRGNDYLAVKKGLGKLMDMTIDMDRFYIPRRRRNRHVKRRMRVLDMRFTSSGGIAVKFDQDLWDSCLPETGYFCRAWPNMIWRLKHPPEIYLALLLDAYGHKISWGIEKIANRMGLRARSRPWIEDRIRIALERIDDATGRQHDATVNDNDVLTIKHHDAADDMKAVFGDTTDNVNDNAEWRYERFHEEYD
jgi:hypothetical protein